MEEISQMLPWNDPANFPKPAASSAYGYRKDDSNHPMSQEQLIRDVQKDTKKAIALVWTPESPQLVPAEEIDFLREAVIVRNKKYLKNQAASTVLQGTLYSLPLIIGLLFANGQEIPSWAIFFFLTFLVIPMAQHGLEWQYQRQMDETKMQAQATLVRYGYWVGKQKKIYITLGLLALILIVGLGQLLFGLEHSVEMAGLVKAAARTSEPWRLVTAAFLHASFLHFFFNMLSLLVLGKQIEVLTHPAYIAIVFLASVVTGSLFSVFFMPETTSIGASGGIMGLLGFLLILAWRNRPQLPPRFVNGLVEAIVWTILAGLTAWQLIDNAAHIGGLLMGCMCGLLCFRRPGQQFIQKRYSLWGYIVGGITSMALIGFAAWTLYMFVLRKP